MCDVDGSDFLDWCRQIVREWPFDDDQEAVETVLNEIEHRTSNKITRRSRDRLVRSEGEPNQN